MDYEAVAENLTSLNPFTQFQTLGSSLTEYFGIEPSFMWVLIILVAALMVTSFIYTITRNLLVTVISSSMILGLGIEIGVIPFWLIIPNILIFGCLIYSNVFGTFGNIGETKEEKVVTEKERIKEHTGQLSEKWSEYHNNLDELLSIETRNNLNNAAISFTFGKYLNINSKKYDWYITDKHEELNIFKIVGLHKKDEDNNKVYLLGNVDNKPFLYLLDKKYLDIPVQVSVLYEKYLESVNISVVLGAMMLGVASSVIDSAISPKQSKAMNKEEWLKSYANRC